jgi:fatty acyl-CoA reductase
MSGKAFNHSLINEFYNNKTVLITGATGLVGKVIVYKLLRSIKSIKKVYILIREKKGKNYLERFEDLITKSRDLFTYIERQSLEKLVPISGDVSLPGLGLNEENRKLILKEVSIVFNAAADITFETNLRYQILDHFLLKMNCFIDYF